MSVNNCQGGNKCPYLNGMSILTLAREVDFLRDRVKDMEGLMELATERIQKLEKEKEELNKEREGLKERLKRILCKAFKPRVKKEGEKIKKGAPLGHQGRSRMRPTEVSEYKDIYPNRCEECGSGDITVYENSYEEHYVEDIKIIKVTTLNRMHYGYCKNCKRTIYPRREELVIKASRVGVEARAIGSYLRYLGLPYRKAAKIFKDIFNIGISHTSLQSFEREQAKNGETLYSAIKEEVKDSSFINIDETGFGVDGENWWLWVFTNKEVALYCIENSRSSEVVRGILGEEYRGVLGSDFYSAYNAIKARAKQRCCAHLLEEIKEIQEANKFTGGSKEEVFCRKLKGIFKGLIEVWKEVREDKRGFDELKEAKEGAITGLIELVSEPFGNEDIARIQKRIIKHHEELLVFLDDPEIEPTNNRAERQLRPSVIMRKITFGNRSEVGAHNHSVIMSIVQSGILNNVNPLDIFIMLTRKDCAKDIDLPQIRGP